MLELLEQQKSLTTNQWKIFTACLFSIVIDFFDFALIGFVLAFFVKDWHLTFGQSGAILFASGIAAIPGGIFFGWLGDKIGRRKVFMMMILTLSLATGVMALAPENGWLFIAAMRFIVGLGVGGLAAVDLPLLQEFAGLEARLGQRPVDRPVTTGAVAGRAVQRVAGRHHRLARLVCDRAGAGGVCLCDPPLGPGIAALVIRPGTL
jgi:MFS family permease